MERKVELHHILELSPNRKMECSIPAKIDVNASLFIEMLLSKIRQQNRNPTVLWNMRPWDNYNFIHAIYCQKIKHLIELEFNCQIILYDKFVEKFHRFHRQQEFDQQKAITKKNVSWLINSGLLPNKTEFFSESILWDEIEFKDFSNKITFIAQLFKKSLDGIKVDEILDRLWELYYEEVIQCDFVITGRRDVTEIWNVVRNATLAENNFNYNPPVVLIFPLINGLNDKSIDPSAKKESLTIHDSREEIDRKIQAASDNFLTDLFELLIIPKLQSRIKVNKNVYNCFNFSDVKDINGFHYKAFAAEFLFDHFQKVING